MIILSTKSHFLWNTSSTNVSQSQNKKFTHDSKMEFQNKQSKAKCIGNYELKQTLGEGEIFLAFFTNGLSHGRSLINEKRCMG